MTENRSCYYTQGQGYLDHITHDPSEGFIKGGGEFFIDLAISLQIRELWPKIGV